MDAFTDPAIHTIVLMVARQTLKTEVINNCIGYVIDQDPGPTLLVQFRDVDCKKWSKIRFAPMLRDTPCLRGKVADIKSRSGESTLEYKAFPGGHLSVVASASPGNLAALPIRFLFCDEIDKYPASAASAGDPISLAQGRQEEFWNRKTVLACTPTIEGLSRIAAAWEQSDQREFEVCCPFCGEFQIPKWGQVKDPRFPGEQPASTAYQCEHCLALWPDVKRWVAIKSGRYRATTPFNGVAGFRVSGICRIGQPLVRLVDEFWSKKDGQETLKTFINEQLAELWREQGEAPDHEKLMARREESYRLGQVPAGVLFLTSGVDWQKRWGEGYVYGWGRGRQRWVVDHFRIERSPFEQAAWDELTTRLNQTYRTQGGIDLSIVRMAVDTGFAANEVYQWARQQGSGRVMAVDGRQHLAALVVPPSQIDVTVFGKKIKHGCKLWPVDVSACKSELYGLLGKDRPAQGEPYPAGWVHFAADLDEEFFKQLTAESLQTHVVKGYRKTEWIKTRERNEALDCANYARAAAFSVGMDRHATDERWWAALEGQFPKTVAKAAPKSASEKAAADHGLEDEIRAPDEAAPKSASYQAPRDRFIPRRNWFER
jgi:phage terminase large subunit GpA-like protein